MSELCVPIFTFIVSLVDAQQPWINHPGLLRRSELKLETKLAECHINYWQINKRALFFTKGVESLDCHIVYFKSCPLHGDYYHTADQFGDYCSYIK